MDGHVFLHLAARKKKQGEKKTLPRREGSRNLPCGEIRDLLKKLGGAEKEKSRGSTHTTSEKEKE